MKSEEIKKIDEVIQDLVYEKVALKKAYNYYHCTRDADQFRHLEDNYGIGTPTSVGFTPLIKKHIDVLVGEYLGFEPELSISCKDENTISNILQEKKHRIDYELYEYLQKYLHNIIIAIISGESSSVDPRIEAELLKIKQNVDKTFISDYEIAAQNILLYFRQSRDLDLKNKMRSLFTDLLITGCGYYRTKPSAEGTNVKFEVLNPLDTFIERNRNEYYLNRSRRAVVRKWMNKQEILNEYGEELSSDAIDKLDDEIGRGNTNYNTIFVSTQRSLIEANGSPTPGILAGLEASPIYPYDQGYTTSVHLIIPVHEVEWLEYNKKTHQTTRHEGVKIGAEIYITRGESKYISRSMSEPKNCTLSINGIFFLDKNGSPFSIMKATMELQDKYDLLIYYRDNLIATSGTTGDWVDMAHIPITLGVEFPERIAKWLAYKKNGLALFDSSQEGTEMLNTTFNGFDDTVKAQSIQAVQIAIESIEMQAAAITGVFPEKLGGIESRDAVSNVKVGIKYSTLLTKQYFVAMDMMFKEINYDLLNLAKLVFDKGMTGVIVLGNKFSKIFTALPEHYTMTDFDIHIQDTSETFQDRETLKTFSAELIRANYADPELIVNIITTKSMTELKQYIEDSMEAKRNENNQLQKLQEQLEEYEQYHKQAEKQLQELQERNSALEKEIEKNSEEKLAIEKKKLELTQQGVINEKEYRNKLIETKEKQIQAEILQMYDSNPYNDKIRNTV